MTEPQTSEDISTKLERIAKLAKKAPEMAFRSRAHHMDTEWLREAYRRTRKDGAAGVDGQNAEDYAAKLGTSAHVGTTLISQRRLAGGPERS
jgi:RNA-directed DNA polymerase